MYLFFLDLHNLLRWLVLISLGIILYKYLVGWLGNRPWEKIDDIIGILFTSLIDMQFLVGLTLYFFLSPVTKMAFADFGSAMKNADTRFYTVEHSLVMLMAVVLIHIGRARSKKAKPDISKFKSALIFFLIAMFLIIIAIPWSRAQ